MSEPVDPFEAAERLAVEAEAAKVAAVRRSWSREDAVARAGLLAHDVSVRRGESSLARKQRVARAQAYAAWEWDGKPAGDGHLAEFGVAGLGTGEVPPVPPPVAGAVSPVPSPLDVVSPDSTQGERVGKSSFRPDPKKK